MQISFDNGQPYIITDSALQIAVEAIKVFAITEYRKLPEPIRVAAIAFTRTSLLFMEMKEKDKQKKALIRPPRHTDATEHLIGIMMNYIKGALPNVSINVSSDDTRNITAIRLEDPDKSGGPLAIDGDKRERENHRGETARPELSSSLSAS